MKKVKRGVVLALVLMLTVALSGFTPAGFGAKKEKGLEKLLKWYDAYQVNGSDESFSKDEDGIVREYATHKLGSSVSIIVGRSGASMTWSSVSIGYRAYKVYYGNRANGFVSCGHGMKDSVDNSVYKSAFSSNRIGRVEETVYNSTCDASFVSVSSGSVSNTTNVNGGVTLTPEVVSVSNGDKVSMCGAKSGLVSNKKVINNNKTITISGIKCTGMIQVEKMSVDGDSGAPVYKNVGGKYKIVGIIRGGGSSYSYVTKASVINSTLGTKAY